MSWVFDLSPWVFCAGLVSLFCIFAVAGVLATRGLSRRLAGDNHLHNEIVNYYITAIGVFYGLTLGLIAVAAWQNFSEADERTAAESAAVAALWRDTGSYPQAERDVLQSTLREYIIYVIREGWPLQRKGQMPARGVEILDRFQSRLLMFDPAPGGQTVLHAEALRQYNHFIELRRLRLHAVTGGMPALMWAILLLGAVITIASTFFLVIENLSTHLILTLLFAALLGMLIFLTAVLDNPFRGEFAIDPSAYQLVFDQMMR